jgi:hypothetical protein
MSNLLKELLAEVKASGFDKQAEAPQEAASPEQQNADILETSQAMISKIDSFLQQVNGGGVDSSQDPQGAAAGVDPNDPNAGAVDPNNPDAAGQTSGNSVHIEVPAGMSVKLASCNPVDTDSALRTIVGLVPTYFGE